MMDKLTILVDYDDTLFPLLPRWVYELNRRFGTSVDYESLDNWDITKAFPTLTEAQVFSPLHSNLFWLDVSPMEGSVEVLRNLKRAGHRIFIVTDSFYQNIPAKMQALFTYFPFLSWDDVIKAKRKQMIAGDVLIDDAVHNHAGGDYIKLLYCSPINRNFPAEEQGMIRVSSWPEVLREIVKIH